VTERCRREKRRRKREAGDTDADATTNLVPKH
jgi:hypothetical protein